MTIQSVGLFASLAGSPPAIPAGTTLAATTGYSAEERGKALYAYDSSLTSTYLADHSRSAFLDSSGRVFRLADQVTERTPYMFGAAGDGTTDDSAALQAFFDDAFPTANAKRCTYDMEGLFAVSQPIYAAYANDEATRRFRAGQILVLPRSQGQSPIDDVLTICGPRQSWQGELAVNDGQAANTGYDSRRFNTGVKMIFASQSDFEVIHVDGAKRDAVAIDGTVGSWSLRTGTAFALSNITRNNIGLQIGSVYARGCGAFNGSSGYGHSQTVSGNVAGGDSSSGNEVFSSSGNYANSNWQRSRLTLGSTAELRRYDFGKVRLELLPADYGTVAANATASTLTWSAGDPVAKGLQVGDVLSPQSGVNSGQSFTIQSFGGTSNRTITVYPAPANESAAALTGLFTQWSFHQIMNVASGTQIDVFPWVPTRSNSKWYAMHGFSLKVTGEDTANVHAGYVSGLLVGGALLSGGLYGCSVSTLLMDWGEIGLQQGLRADAGNLGTVIDHIHTEAATVDFLQVTGVPVSRCIIKGGSDFNLPKVVVPYVRSQPSDAAPLPRILVNTTIDRGGEILESNTRSSYSGSNYFQDSSALSNHPSQREATAIGDGPISVQVDYNDDVARLFGEHHRAELLWIGASGAAPAGTLTFSLSPALTSQGWSFGGVTGAVTSPAKPCLFRLRFHKSAKKVLIARFDAA